VAVLGSLISAVAPLPALALILAPGEQRLHHIKVASWEAIINAVQHHSAWH